MHTRTLTGHGPWIAPRPEVDRTQRLDPTALANIFNETVRMPRRALEESGPERKRRSRTLEDTPSSAAAERVPQTPAEPSGVRRLPRIDPMALNKLVVSTYKVAGFAILTIILVGLVSYLGINVYYFVSSSWVVPTVLSPTDERVLQLDALAAQQEAAKGGLVTKRLELEAELKTANRILDVELAFQDAFRDAMVTDLSDRKTQLARLRSLLSTYAASKRSILRSNEAYAGMSRESLREQYGAHVISQEEMLTGNYQLAQIAGANLGLDQKSVEISAQVAELTREVASLESAHAAAVSGKRTNGQVSYDVLHIKHEFDQSVLASSKARHDAEALAASVAMLGDIIVRHERLIDMISRSPYVMAADKNLTMAFVPYENKKNVAVGAPVYGCKMGLVWCSRVGAVAEIIDGEVLAKHPLHNKDLRGVMVRLSLDDPKWIEQPVLHVGGRPLFL
jgi:hypothetical protein